MKLNKITDIFSEIKEVPPILDQKTYPSLNGLRAISIIMVLFSHFIHRYYVRFDSLTYLGTLGVDVFFVISGFLITTLCIKEKAITGNLSLKNFYIRRALRILPVAYLYIFVIATLNYFLKLNITFLSFVSSAFFLANLSFFKKPHLGVQSDWNLGHYWSLAVEEQFYILFPIFIKKKFSVYVGILVTVIFLVPLIIYFQSIFSSLNIGILTAALRYVIKFQGIAIGCLFSVLLFKGYLNFGQYKLPLTVISIFMIFYLKFDVEFSLESCFKNLATSVFVGFIVVNNISPQTNVIYKFLNLKVLNFIGILSYSIYIWQQLFLSNDPKFPLSKYPINLIFLAIIPCLSYFYYEKYFLKLKARFIKTKQHKKEPLNIPA